MDSEKDVEREWGLILITILVFPWKNWGKPGARIFMTLI
jgi:hypothetical protein